MARIAGVNLPNEKKVKIGVTYIYGIGDALAKKLLEQAGVDGEKRVKDLSETEANNIQKVISEFQVEGQLRRMVRDDINRLKTIGSYRGTRHKRGLPCRGQKTKTNARTRKGKGMPVGKKKQEGK